jgi:carboxymethylenebutenolidase
MSDQETLAGLWEEHIRHEFETKSTDDTIATMVEDAYVNHVPVMTGGFGKPELRQFYSAHFIPKMPPDLQMTSVSRTIGTDQLVEEMVLKFTHTVEIDWMLPGDCADRQTGGGGAGRRRPLSRRQGRT